MARTLPPMMQVMKDIGGVEMPEYLARLTRDSRPGEGAFSVAGNGSATPTPAGESGVTPPPKG
jgi:flotillin